MLTTTAPRNVLSVSFRPRNPVCSPVEFLKQLRTSLPLAIALAATPLLAVSTDAATSDHTARDRSALIALYEATDGRNWREQDAWLTDEPLHSWQGVSLSDGRVTRLRLPNNRLVGRLPPEVGMLTELRRLELPGNSLEGRIPDTIGALSALTHLDLRWNSLDGHIPPPLAKLTNLVSLLLSANRLTGPIPDFGGLVGLTRLDLSYNELRGEIPKTLGRLTQLNALGLRSNRLNGPIPPQLAGMGNLSRLYLDDNELIGEIPAEFGNFTELTHLDLSSNALRGRIPPQLGNLRNLVWLGLGKNLLVGEIPAQLGNLSNLAHLDLQSREPAALGDEVGNQGRLSGPLPMELSALAHLRYVDIRGNAFDGELPDGAGVLSERVVIRLDAEQCESELRGVESMTFEYVCGRDESHRPMRATASLAETTADLPDGEFYEMAIQAMATIIIRDGYAHLDVERIPNWLDRADAVAMVERFNVHLRDADFTIKTPDDLIRAFETYAGETLEISLPRAAPPGIPESGMPHSMMKGDGPLPTTHEQVDPLGEASNASSANAVVAYHYCNVGANAPSRVDQRVMATADGSCYTVFANPDVRPPRPTWSLILALQRQEGFWIWGGWVLIGSAQHTRFFTYSPVWDDVDVPSEWCPNGNNRAWGGIIFQVPWPYTANGNPIPVYPATTDIEGCKWRPGDCTFAEHDILRDAVDANCKYPPPIGCPKGPQSCGVFREKYAHFGRCLSARRTRENTCFDGGDGGHIAQIEQLEIAQGKCRDRFRENNCSGTID